MMTAKINKKMVSTMKKFYIILAAALVAAACNSENNTVKPIHGTKVAQINGTIEETKSGMEFIETGDVSTSRIETWWLQGDRILVTDGDTDSIYESTAVFKVR